MPSPACFKKGVVRLRTLAPYHKRKERTSNNGRSRAGFGAELAPSTAAQLFPPRPSRDRHMPKKIVARGIAGASLHRAPQLGLKGRIGMR